MRLALSTKLRSLKLLLWSLACQRRRRRDRRTINRAEGNVRDLKPVADQGVVIAPCLPVGTPRVRPIIATRENKAGNLIFKSARVSRYVRLDTKVSRTTRRPPSPRKSCHVRSRSRPEGLATSRSWTRLPQLRTLIGAIDPSVLCRGRDCRISGSSLDERLTLPLRKQVLPPRPARRLR
jgi:hypothetical protein